MVKLGAGTITCLDSASLVGPGDSGRIVITGSHGALIGGDPSRAIKAHARAAVFNDAGFGIDNIGVTRLPALETGIISCTNRTARALGAVQNGRLADWLTRLSC